MWLARGLFHPHKAPRSAVKAIACLTLAFSLGSSPAALGGTICQAAIDALLGQPGPLTGNTPRSRPIAAQNGPIIPGNDPRSIKADLRPYTTTPLPAGSITLGTGTFAIVYRGPVTVDNGCMQADAIIKINRSNDPLDSPDTLLQLAAREYLALMDMRAAVTDPNELFDLGFPEPLAVGWLHENQADNVPGLVMRPIAAAEVMSDRIGATLGPQHVIALAIASARSLEQVHRARVHGDIKPGNMMVRAVGPNFKVTFIDFGTAGLVGQAATGMTMGFVDPAAFANGTLYLNYANDIYALARSLERVAYANNPGLPQPRVPSVAMPNNPFTSWLHFPEHSLYTNMANNPTQALANVNATKFYSPFLYFSEIFASAAAMRTTFEQLAQVGSDPLRLQQALDGFRDAVVGRFQAGNEAAKITIAGKIATSRELLEWMTAPQGQPQLRFQAIAAELAGLLRRYVAAPANDTAIRSDMRYPFRLDDAAITAAANALSPP